MKKLPKDIIISLFDYSGSWSLPFKKAGYVIFQVDLKLGIDILTWDYKFIDRNRVAGIIAAPPCTDYTVAGNRFWKAKDRNGSTQLSNSLVSKTLEIIAYFKPDFWAIENPKKSRLTRMLAGNYEPGEPTIDIPASLKDLVSQPALAFNPCDYGDNWNKETYLWGVFNELKTNPALTHRWTKQGSWTQQLGGKSEKTKELRSLTPGGFARAFFDANNPMNFELEEHLYMFQTCKFGMWTCDFVVSKDMCDICEEADNYEPNDYALEFESEEEFMQAVFDKGEGIRRSIDPERIYSYK